MEIFPNKRPFILQPGESLLVSNDPETYGAYLQEFVDTTGLAPNDEEGRFITIDPVSKIPFPLYPDSFASGKRWPDLDPRVMWNPLFWLPESLAFGEVISDPHGVGEPIPESEDEWVIRVATNLEYMGLYDPETGMWADILSAAGIDIDDPVSVERVQAWMNGGEDDVLDQIDLSFLLPQDDNVDEQAFDNQDGYRALTLTNLAQKVGEMSSELTGLLEAEPDTLTRANMAHYLTLCAGTLAEGVDNNTRQDIEGMQESAENIMETGVDPNGLIPQIPARCEQIASQVWMQFGPAAEAFQARQDGSAPKEITA